MLVVLSILNRVLFLLFPLVIMVCWSYGTEIRDRGPLLPRSMQGGRTCPSMRWNGGWILKCSSMSIHVGRQGVASPPNSSGDVPPNSPFREKGGRTHDLQRSPTWPPTSGPTGGTSPLSRQWDLYYQISKLWRLPGSPLCGPEWIEELVRDMVSSLKNHLRQKGGQPPRGPEESKPADTWPSWSKNPKKNEEGHFHQKRPCWGEGGHWRALAAAATLEERIERLGWSITRGWPDTHAHPWSCDYQRRRSWGQKRRCCRALPEDNPPQWGPETWEDEEAELHFLEFDLGPPPELGSNVDYFLQELANNPRGDNGRDAPRTSHWRNMKGG